MDAVVAVAARLVNVLTAGEAHGRSYRPPDDKARRAAVTAALQIAMPATRLVAAYEAAGSTWMPRAAPPAGSAPHPAGTG